MRVMTRPRTLSLLLLTVGFVIFCIRRPEMLLRPTLWGEDGALFLSNALSPGQDLLSRYTGQLWVAQRLAFAVIAQVPPVAMPMATYLASCAVSVFSLGVVLQRRAQPLFGSFQMQALAFFLLLLIPAVVEIHGNFANIQVWLAIGLIVVLVLPPPGSLLGQIAEVAFVVISCLTGVVGAIAAPVALWAMVKHRSRYVWLRSGIVLAGAMLSVFMALSGGRGATGQLTERLALLPLGLVRRLGGGLILGQQLLDRWWTGSPIHLLLIPALLMTALLAYLTWIDRRGPSPAWLAAGLAWVVLGTVSPVGESAPEWLFQGYANWRYFGLLLAASLLILVRAASLGGATSKLAITGLLGCTLAIIVNARIPEMEPAPTRAELQAFDDCLRQEGPATCTLIQAPEGWQVVVRKEQ